MPELSRRPLVTARRSCCYSCGSPVAPMTWREYLDETRRRGGPRLSFALHLAWLWRCTSCSILGASLAL